MKVIAAIEVDPHSNALGLRSRALEVLSGRSVIGRVLERVLRVEGIEGAVVVTSAEHKPVVEEAGIHGGVEVIETELRDIPRRDGLRRLRKWGLSCWRGGMWNALYFDEQGSPFNLLAAAEASGADSVLWVPEGAVLFDPEIASGMVRQHERYAGGFPFTFSQAPPGLAGAIYGRGFLEEEGEMGRTLGDLFVYTPGLPRRDPIEFGCNYELGEAVRFGPFRFAADSRRGVEMLDEFFRVVPGADEIDAAGAVAAVWARPELRAGRFPKEVRVEVTNRCNLSCNFCPRKEMARDEADMEFETFRRLVKELGEYDDVRVTLGGLGEPLLHPEVGRMIRAAREAGIFGVHLETNGVLLEGELMEEIVAAGPDVISVSVDADSAETYRSLKGTDAFEKVKGNVERLIEYVRGRPEPWPVVCVSMVKLAENENEMEAFFDRWYAQGCWPVIRGYNDYAGQLAQRNPLPMALSERIPCRKLEDELTILSDGRAAVCGQDFDGKESVGSVAERSVKEIWNSDRMWGLRRSHQAGDYEGFRLCEKCVDWYYV